jgi:hypothetical protein
MSDLQTLMGLAYANENAIGYDCRVHATGPRHEENSSYENHTRYTEHTKELQRSDEYLFCAPMDLDDDSIRRMCALATVKHHRAAVSIHS